MATRITLRIQERISRLTAAEQKLAAVLLENQAMIETHSATELSALAGVSKATTARFFRNLGYTDFEEARTQAREERNRTQPYAYAATQPEGIALGRSIGDHLDLELANLTRTFEEMRPDLLSEAARLIIDAPRVWVMGYGAEAGIARYARTLFSRLRPDVNLLGQDAGAWAEDLAMTGPRDALLLMSLEPRPKFQSALTAYARTTRMNVITLTDHRYFARAQRFSRLVIGCHVANYGLIPSHTTFTSLIRLLAIAFVSEAGESARQRMSVIDEINEEIDLFD
ncbi:MAG: MurR/RpiR family transcriptional regulator [Rhodobacter sp.]|nr:MurR/RpiR family transcriptional regulator [Paracoccaceae bacterium]MCC0075138.1 MurR/RpiR family transcriptional regulator [Rhodobacter sp.]